MGFIQISEVSDVPNGKMKMFKVGQNEYLVANVNGNYYAISNRCSHSNGDLSQGSLNGNIVMCPKHKSTFDVTTGKVLSGPKVPLFHPKIDDATTFEVKVEGKALLLKID